MFINMDAHSGEFCGRLQDFHGCVREGKGDVPPGLTPRHVILSSMGTGVFFTTVKHYSISGGGGDINAEIT